MEEVGGAALSVSSEGSGLVVIGVVVPMVIGGGGAVVGGRCGSGGVAGTAPERSEPAMVFGVWLPSGPGLLASVKFVVVSTAVSVSDVVAGGGCSPGALMVEVTPLVDPSWTTA